MGKKSPYKMIYFEYIISSDKITVYVNMVYSIVQQEIRYHLIRMILLSTHALCQKYSLF